MSVAGYHRQTDNEERVLKTPDFAACHEAIHYPAVVSLPGHFILTLLLLCPGLTSCGGSGSAEPVEHGVYDGLLQWGGGGVGAAILISRLTISVDARVLVSATEADVHIDGESVLRAGRPLFSVSGSLGVRL